MILKVDRFTSIHSRGRYGTICIKVDLKEKLLSAIEARGEKFLLEYEGLHLINFSCGNYGHKMSQCSKIREEA
uniref:CCHC-type domain-containing protein n=1 Tax=Cajanus cajan TaxID=3821 RepID=A0A151SFI1_CAJCA|nr:hypothetical protein KK1_024489 [Cajanus cajan]